VPFTNPLPWPYGIFKEEKKRVYTHFRISEEEVDLFYEYCV